ncbi:hypothetical protein NARC_10136 [Candidatus Nitrosocosmicus arcticus]|uniref:Uncharacterized protein n=1 Tax=Candidatus Nitrosocosmicus arcticus TaxID=2035267 RepID=A0A557SYP3_9ARCH|nr:hypothetical protein NARC_10136 [Candidatus Nitrosocosmicus arcticus]
MMQYLGTFPLPSKSYRITETSTPFLKFQKEGSITIKRTITIKSPEQLRPRSSLCDS